MLILFQFLLIFILPQKTHSDLANFNTPSVFANFDDHLQYTDKLYDINMYFSTSYDRWQ